MENIRIIKMIKQMNKDGDENFAFFEEFVSDKLKSSVWINE